MKKVIVGLFLSTWVCSWRGFLWGKCSYITYKGDIRCYTGREKCPPRKLKILWCFFRFPLPNTFISFSKYSEATRNKRIWKYLLRKASICMRAAGSCGSRMMTSWLDNLSAPAQNLYNDFSLFQWLTWHNEISTKPIKILVPPAPTLGP